MNKYFLYSLLLSLSVYGMSSGSAPAASSCVSSTEGQATPTEMAGQSCKQGNASLDSILRNPHEPLLTLVEEKLNEVRAKAKQGSMVHAHALSKIGGIMQDLRTRDDSDSDEELVVQEDEEIFPILKETGLIQYPHHHLTAIDNKTWMLRDGIAAALKKQRGANK